MADRDDHLAGVARDAVARRSPASRACSSTKDSPLGKRKPDGWRCTVCHSGSLRERPPAPRRSTRRSRTRAGRARPRPAARAAARSAARSRGPARAARRRPPATEPSAARRSATRSASLDALARRGGGPGPTGQDLAGRRRRAVPDEADDRRSGRRRRRGGIAPNVAWATMSHLDGATPVTTSSSAAARSSRETRRSEIAACRACPRLVAWREHVGADAAPRRRRGLLGAAAPGFGDPDAGARRRRSRAGGPRRQPHRPDVHRRPIAATSSSPRCTAPATPTRPTSIGARRRTRARRRVRHRRGALCAAGQPADADRARPLRALPRRGARAARARPGRARARGVRARGALATVALRPATARGRRFAHGLEVPSLRAGAAATLLCSYHPSQRNVFTGLLTRRCSTPCSQRAPRARRLRRCSSRAVGEIGARGGGHRAPDRRRGPAAAARPARAGRAARAPRGRPRRARLDHARPRPSPRAARDPSRCARASGCSRRRRRCPPVEMSACSAAKSGHSRQPSRVNACASLSGTSW